jgi:glutathione S-transferase
MLKIWGRRNSVNVQKVLWCVGELGIAYELVDAGMSFGVNNEAWYLEKNPNGLVPMIEYDGKILWESNAIVRYLASQFGKGTLCPSDPHKFAQADMWMDWQLGMVMPGLNPVFLGLVRTTPEKRDVSAIKAGEARLKKAFTALDSHLGAQAFLVGDTLTMADIAVGCVASRWYLLDIERPDLPNMKSWFERISARSMFKKYVPQDLS